MRPSELKSLKGFIAAIREEIASFRDVFKEGAASISDQNKAHQQSEEYQREKILHSIDNLANQKNESDSTSETNQNRRHRQNLWVQWTLAGFTFLAFAAAAIYAEIAARQLIEATKATEAATKSANIAACALRENQRQFQETLGEMKGQTSIQRDAASATQDAANAAKRAADIANETLHITQRAYITVPTPTLDFDRHTVTISLVNVGHIPTGPITGEMHEATFPVADPGQYLGNVPTDELHWNRANLAAIPQDTHIDIGVIVPALLKEAYDSGHQEFIVAGFITYTDGFPKSPQIKIPICWRSQFHLVLKVPAIRSCDADYFLPNMIKADGYPNNEQK
jgi:hypothetical protein